MLGLELEVLLVVSSRFDLNWLGLADDDLLATGSDLDRWCFAGCSALAFFAATPDTTDDPLLDRTQPPRTNSGVGGGRLGWFDDVDKVKELELRSL